MAAAAAAANVGFKVPPEVAAVVPGLKEIKGLLDLQEARKEIRGIRG